MRPTVEWLAMMEKMSPKVYADAAERFSGDAELAGMLTKLAADEEYHHRLMGRFLDEADRVEMGRPQHIAVDEGVRQPIERAGEQVKAKFAAQFGERTGSRSQ